MTTGFTNEEKFLIKLGMNSFLRFWSWPNLFRDQGNTTNGDGKEICDLTVIFGNDVLFFSDKKIIFNKDKSINIAWSRWARRAVYDSIKQIQGAIRWFNKYPDRVFIDKKCKTKPPLQIPHSSVIRYHNIVVCHGIEEFITEHNKESSFFIDNSLKNEMVWDSEHAIPFTIGDLNYDGFTHVFNEKTIELVLNEFDTAQDFISYLKEREKLINNQHHVYINSESDLIQLYYLSMDENEKRYIINTEKLLNGNKIHINKGGIHKLHTNPYYIEKKNADHISYFWDDLISSFSFHILNGTSERNNWSSPDQIEPAIREMAATTRFERRVLADSFIEFYNKAKPNQRGTRFFLNPLNPGFGYLFLALPSENAPSKDKYRDIRLQMLEDYCVINKHLNKNIHNILGIAFKTREQEDQEVTPQFFGEGQDYIYMTFDQWTTQDQKNAEDIYNEYVSNGLLAKRNMYHGTVNEFPISLNNLNNLFAHTAMKKPVMKGIDRNKPCPCGSGVKFKKCCGKS